MDEKKIFDDLKNDAEKTVIPESLRPENMINMLGEQIDKECEASRDVNEANRELQKNNIRKQSKSIIKRFVAVAGGLAAIVATVLVGMGISQSTESKKDIYVPDEVVNGGFKTLTSYKELAEYVKESGLRVDLELNGGSKGEIIEDAIIDMPEADIEGEMPTYADDDMLSNEVGDNVSDGEDFSDTNVRTDGVLEADCIKTDGKYIFALAEKNSDIVLDIAKTDGKNTEYIAQYKLKDMIIAMNPDKEGTFYANNMILSNTKIIVLGTIYGNNYNDSETIVAVFDRSDVMDVKLLKNFFVSGEYNQCRMNGGYLYVVSDYRFTLEEIEPAIDDEPMDCKDIYLSDTNRYKEYMIFTTYSMNEQPELIDNKAVVHDGTPEIYATMNNIYVLSSEWKPSLINGGKEILGIMKFVYCEGVITADATTKIDGWLEDVFCVDEYNNYLRIVVTSYKNYDEINTLYVFDSGLNEVGIIEDIAPGERIYSARFDGKIGYFVTFKQIDPLFSVDLSDPANPKIIGELKIPGFSEYMHMWDDGKMLGIGEENGMIKLSMFNISDPYNVTEEDKAILDNVYYSEALYNHKAILVSGTKNIIGFSADGLWSDFIDDELHFKESQFYYLYTYENGKFVQEAAIEMNGMNYGQVRGMYIGDYIYVVRADGVINVVTMGDFELIKTVEQIY